MNWLNIRLVNLRSAEYIGSDPVGRATWLSVIAYCCEQENGGRIVGARSWKDRQWQQTCGVTLEEVDGTSLLLKWDGNDLVVWSYPADKEYEIQSKREAGSRGGYSKAKRAREAQPEESAKHEHKLNCSSATSSANGSAPTEEEGERNRKENRNGTTTLPASQTPRGMKDGEGKPLLPTTDQSKRIAKLFHRKLTTSWSQDEYAAYRKIGIVPDEDLEAIENYYAENWPPKTGQNILRHDLQTFLNNFTGELDRAKNYMAGKSQERSSLFTS